MEDYVETIGGFEKKAEKFIFLEYYIVEEGLSGTACLKFSKKKLLRSVEVKMLYDDIGCMVTSAR